MVTAEWILDVHNSYLSWAGGASGAGHIRTLLHLDIDVVDVCGAEVRVLR